MANSANVRASLSVDVFLDSNAALVGGAPVSVLCNRQYDVRDFALAITTAEGNQGEDGRLIIGTVTPAGAETVLGEANAQTTGWRRPASITTGSNPVLNALVVTNNTTATVVRGNSLRVRALSTTAGTLGSAIRGNGTITILPGNRYAAGAGTYYPNNGSALQA
jgi:hypothetical protein